MPASGRMYCKIVSAPEQRQVIAADPPVPWQSDRLVKINFDLWEELTQPQRDLIFLRTVSWLTGFRWFKFDWMRGAFLAGILVAGVELSQGDAIGTVAAGGLAAIAATQIWRNSRSAELEIEADEAAVRTAQRRGYTEADAARHLLSGIEAVAQIENRFGLDFTELLRCQNLRAIAGLSAIPIPDNLKP
ncbi:MAG TPA: DUF3318 domain-containing protein [Synechococcales cyanobacterium M55_K2018_004]|nr:DUF3318 domain-containing protein [Synechococcales cyanobacterium M55_K2018_004]